MFLRRSFVKIYIVWSLRNREVACSASDRQGSNFKSFVWRGVSVHSSYRPQNVLLAQFSLDVHKGGLKVATRLSYCDTLFDQGSLVWQLPSAYTSVGCFSLIFRSIFVQFPLNLQALFANNPASTLKILWVSISKVRTFYIVVEYRD